MIERTWRTKAGFTPVLSSTSDKKQKCNYSGTWTQWERPFLHLLKGGWPSRRLKMCTKCPFREGILFWRGLGAVTSNTTYSLCILYDLVENHICTTLNSFPCQWEKEWCSLFRVSSWPEGNTCCGCCNGTAQPAPESWCPHNSHYLIQSSRYSESIVTTHGPRERWLSLQYSGTCLLY